MRKVYIAPESVLVTVNAGCPLCDGSVRIYDENGNLDEKHTWTDGDLEDGDEVGAKGNGFGNGLGIWED